MSVILASAAYTVAKRSHPEVRDAEGEPVPGPPGAPTPALPGLLVRHSDDTWSAKLDPATWPVRAGDLVSDGTSTWILTGTPVLHVNNADGALDHVAATALLNPEETV